MAARRKKSTGSKSNSDTKSKEAKDRNDIPNGCTLPELPDHVEWITVRIPVSRKQPLTDRPFSVDKLTMRLLSVQQRRGVNRVYDAISVMAMRDQTLPAKRRQIQPYMNSRAEAARYVFTLIDKACQEQLGEYPQGQSS